MRGNREMIERLTAFRKSNEYSVDRWAGAYVSSGKNRSALKYRSTVPYPNILGPEMFEIQILFLDNRNRIRCTHRVSHNITSGFWGPQKHINIPAAKRMNIHMKWNT